MPPKPTPFYKTAHFSAGVGLAAMIAVVGSLVLAFPPQGGKNRCTEPRFQQFDLVATATGTKGQIIGYWDTKSRSGHCRYVVRVNTQHGPKEITYLEPELERN